MIGLAQIARRTAFLGRRRDPVAVGQRGREHLHDADQRAHESREQQRDADCMENGLGAWRLRSGDAAPASRNGRCDGAERRQRERCGQVEELP